MSTITRAQIVGDEIQIPVELWRNDSGIFVVSLSLPRTYFREPFFTDSLAKSFSILKSGIKVHREDTPLTRPVHYDEKDKRVIYTPINEFVQRHSGVRVDKKPGFIFHMSRCGSTLTAQMLAISNRFFVLSEPTIINSVLDPALNISQENRSQLLLASIKALAMCSPKACDYVFIKFRSWNVLYLEYILQNFPDVSWMFIHRYGLEVLQSVLEKPPGWLRSRRSYARYFSDFLGIDEKSLRTISDNEYASRMLGIFCRTARNLSSQNSMFVDYDNLKNDFATVMKKLWNIDLTTEEIHAMERISTLDSKDASKTKLFEPDSKTKIAKSTKIQKTLVSRFVENERVKLTNQ